ncbi:hypothetical protein [Pseudosporangium ferrugineum]|uniref:Acyl carrier protein n=1 Tax=Pseudosporangium ferrugineum TaxID=439699 RepID=A0A2T0SB06_9ACTN|nr:hypothetical protein [Pseudosporangium ferrugineum]PRY30503.1 acyl carrier protein [Pseudosporangium ferrugineum]
MVVIGAAVRVTTGRIMIERSQFISAFEEFVAGIGPDRSITALQPGDNLFDAGVLDSFTVVRVIVFLEELLGRPVDLDDAGIDSFATMDSIYGTFVATG